MNWQEMIEKAKSTGEVSGAIISLMEIIAQAVSLQIIVKVLEGLIEIEKLDISHKNKLKLLNDLKAVFEQSLEVDETKKEGKENWKFMRLFFKMNGIIYI